MDILDFISTVFAKILLVANHKQVYSLIEHQLHNVFDNKFHFLSFTVRWNIAIVLSAPHDHTLCTYSISYLCDHLQMLHAPESRNK